MDVDAKIQLASRGASEIVTKEDLRHVFEGSENPRGYIGVEPSGLFHVGWMIWAQKLIDLINAGVHMVVLEATWHAAINDKLGGDLNNIRKCAKYLEHCLFALNVEPGKVEFLTAESLMDNLDYWELVIRSAKNMTLSRVKRAMTILGRKASEAQLDFSKCIYPSLQVSDIFALKLDICLGGMDQRRAHILAREIAPKLGFKKPVAIHTPLLMGLSGARRMETVGKSREEIEINFKMSKSEPETAIFIHDSPEEVDRKIKNAYCPPREVKYNPILDINQKILFQRLDKLLVDRPAKYGGPIEFHSFEELAKAYAENKVHPLDLKNATSEALISILKRVREYFQENREAARLLEEVKQMSITR
jgi:tyrosyl-tRNA synthetase